MQEKNKRTSLFTEIVRAILPTWWLRSPSASASGQRSTLYRRCDELPLYNFKQCLIYNKLEYLAREGHPPLADLVEAWGGIYLEYIELIRNPETEFITNLQQIIALDQYTLSAEIDLGIYLLPACSTANKISLSAIMQEKGFTFKPVYESREEYERDYNRMVSKLAPIKLRLSTNIKELDKYVRNVKNNTIDEHYFDEMLTKLWGYYRQPLREKEITVKEFVMLLGDYNRYKKAEYEALENANSRRNGDTL